MGRSSDYSKEKFEKDKKTDFEIEKELADKTKMKLHKEPITADELAAYLSCYSRGHIHFDGKKVRERIKNICDCSNGLLNLGMFKLDSSKKRSHYIFQPETHGLLLTILDTGYFDDRKNDRKLRTREDFYRELAVNVNAYLQKEDQEMVKSNPAFVNAECEGILSQAINGKMQRIVGDAMNCDETIRLQQLQRIYDGLCKISEENRDEEIRMFASKCVYQHTFDDKKGAKYYKELFGADNLFDYLICLLALRVKGLNFDSLPEMEKKNYRTLYELAKTEDDPHWVSLGETDAEECLNKLKEDVEYHVVLSEKYQRVMQKALRIIDTSDSDEVQLLNDLVAITRVRMGLSNMDKEMMNLGTKYYEAAMQEDAMDLINKFRQGKINTVVTDELRRIEKVAAHNQNLEN